jgi:DNA sulfur modification protein DndD
MHIRSVHFRDWKAFADATFTFPRPTQRKNVVLIDAKNGYGKTTLLEGLVLGLFGRDGLSLVGRATFGENAGDRIELSYNDFLERAFHGQARAQGRSAASVTLEFENDEGVATRILRRWHFSGSGRHRPDQEEVMIWDGPDGELVTIPRLQDRDDFVRSYIARQFLPVSLAQFFLFDGEQVQRLAKRDMSAQVKLGIEGILGVPIIRELHDDLVKYARDRRSGLASAGDERVDRLRAEIREMESREEGLVAELRKIEPALEPLRERRAALLKEITSLQGGTYANLKELFEGRESYSRRAEHFHEELRQLLSGDMALALAGPVLRSATAAQLRAESTREKWELGKAQGDTNFDRFIAALDTTPPSIAPPLTAAQRDALTDKLRNAWQSLWYPPPDGCAEQYHHPYLSENLRVAVVERLERVEDLAINVITGLLEQIAYFEGEVRRVDARVAQQSGVEQQAERIRIDLESAIQRLSELEASQRDLQRDLEGLRGQLNPKRQELARAQESLQSAAPNLRRAAKADTIANMLDQIIDEAFPLHVADVAAAMTDAYRTMAHKDVVRRIEIEADCAVRLLGGSGMRDVREMDASAGESQIFALSLIAAISRVSQRTFPIVMDTPLARLDPEHRRNVLRYFTTLKSQVILLSQPAEVSGEYMELIQPRTSAVLHLEHEHLGDGVGRTRVRPGLYEEVA